MAATYNTFEMAVCSGVRRRDTATEHLMDGPKPPDGTADVNQFNYALLEMDDAEQELDSSKVKGQTGNSASSRGLLTYFSHLSESGKKDTVDFNFIETLLIAGADVNYSDRYNQTILHAVAKDWSTSVSCFLLRNGADADHGDQYGRTPLHVAAIFNYPDMIRCLVEAGANIEAESVEKQTPLHMAAKKDAVNSVAELLKLGAKLTAKDGKGRTPLHVAADWGSPQVAKYLLNHGAPAGIHDHFGNLCISSMIFKMPDVASKALSQFEYQDTAMRDTQYYLWTVDSTPSRFVRNFAAKSTLETVVLYGSTTVITAPVLQKLIQVKWKLFGFKYTMISVIVNVIYTLIWTILGFLTPRDDEFYFPIKDYIWRILLEIVLLTITAYFVVKQVMKIRRKQRIFAAWKLEKVSTLESELQGAHPRYPEERRMLTNEIQRIKRMTKGNVFTDFWIILESIFILMVVVVFSLRGAYEYTHEISHHGAVTKRLKTAHDISYAVLLFALWLRIMKEFRAFAFLASFITLLGHVAADAIKFALLFMDIFIPYVVIFYMFFGGPENQKIIAKAGDGTNYFNNIIHTCMTVWSVTLVADFPYAGIFAINEYAAELVVATYWALSSLICINLFIALMSETFSRVYSNAQAAASLQLAAWLGEIEAGLNPKDKLRVESYMKKRCNPLLLIGNQNVADFDQQKMKIMSLSSQVDQLKLKANQFKINQDCNAETLKLAITKIRDDLNSVAQMIQLVVNQQEEINSLLTSSGFKQAGQMLKSMVGRVSSCPRPDVTVIPDEDFPDMDSYAEDWSDQKQDLRRTKSHSHTSNQKVGVMKKSQEHSKSRFLKLPLWK